MSPLPCTLVRRSLGKSPLPCTQSGEDWERAPCLVPSQEKPGKECLALYPARRSLGKSPLPCTQSGEAWERAPCCVPSQEKPGKETTFTNKLLRCHGNMSLDPFLPTIHWYKCMLKYSNSESQATCVAYHIVFNSQSNIFAL